MLALNLDERVTVAHQPSASGWLHLDRVTLRALGSPNPGISLGSSGINEFLLLCRIHSHIHTTSISEGTEPGMASPSVFKTNIPSPRGFHSGAWGRNDEKLIRQSKVGWQTLWRMDKTESGDEENQGSRRAGILSKDGREPRVWLSDGMLAWYILSPGFHF